MSAKVRFFTTLLVAAALGVAQVASAYVIFLKDGTRLVARDQPRIRGDKLIFETKIGVQQSVRLAELDVERTEAVNRGPTGDAYVLVEPPSATGRETKFEKQKSLTQYIRENETRLEFKEPPPPPAGGSTGPRPMTVPTEAPAQTLDPQTNDTFLRALGASGIRGPRLSGIPGGVRIQALTDNEQQVFAALGAIARGLKEARAAGQPVNNVEVYLATAAGELAGRFEMTAEDADALLNGRISVQKYFVASVVF